MKATHPFVLHERSQRQKRRDVTTNEELERNFPCYQIPCERKALLRRWTEGEDPDALSLNWIAALDQPSDHGQRLHELARIPAKIRTLRCGGTYAMFQGYAKPAPGICSQGPNFLRLLSLQRH